MPDGNTTTTLSKLLNVTPQTVRNRAAAFSDHLSSNAAPVTGRKHRFTQRDIRVMLRINDLEREGLKTEAIRAQLGEDREQGYFDVDESDFAPMDSPLPAGPLATAMEYERRLIEMGVAYATAKERAELLEQEVLALRQRVAELERQLGKMEGRLEMGGPEEITRLHRELGRLEATLELQRKQGES